MSGGSNDRMDGGLVDNLALAQSPTEVAEEAGVSRRADYGRMKDPEFRKQVAQRRAMLLDEFTGRVTEAAGGAIVRIQLLLLDSESEQIQLQAARTILGEVGRLQRVMEFASRHRKVEELAPQTDDGIG